jgi:hypothetical protein
MPILYKQYLSGDVIYTCGSCGTHAADHEELVSKAFQGRHGRAYLFSQVVNVTQGPLEERMLITGMHRVCDIQCSTCGSVLGWKYDMAYEESQKYKEGKYILEKAKVVLRREDGVVGNGVVGNGTLVMDTSSSEEDGEEEE